MARWTLGSAALLCAAAMLASPGQSQQALSPPPPRTASAPTLPAVIEAKAEEILKASCTRLAAARAMSFDALNTYQRAARNGQPLFYATLNRVMMQRPDKLRVITPGDGVPDEFYYDGKTMMAYVPSEDLVAMSEAPPTIDQMLGAAWEKA